MEKPDFNSDSWELYNSTSDNLRREGFQAGCEYVWDTHVVPLHEENMREKARKEDIRRSYDQMTKQIAIIVNERQQLESENKSLQEEKKTLGERLVNFSRILEEKQQEAQDWYEKLKIAEHLKELDDDAIVTLQREIERLKAEVERFNSDRKRDRIVEGFLNDQRDNPK